MNNQNEILSSIMSKFKIDLASHININIEKSNYEWYSIFDLNNETFKLSISQIDNFYVSTIKIIKEAEQNLESLRLKPTDIKFISDFFNEVNPDAIIKFSNKIGAEKYFSVFYDEIFKKTSAKKYEYKINNLYFFCMISECCDKNELHLTLNKMSKELECTHKNNSQSVSND